MQNVYNNGKFNKTFFSDLALTINYGTNQFHVLFYKTINNYLVNLFFLLFSCLLILTRGFRAVDFVITSHYFIKKKILNIFYFNIFIGIHEEAQNHKPIY